MLDLEGDKLKVSERTVNGNVFYSWEVAAMNYDVWDRVLGLGSLTWTGCDLIELSVDQARLTGSGIISLISREQCRWKYRWKIEGPQLDGYGREK